MLGAGLGALFAESAPEQGQEGSSADILREAGSAGQIVLAVSSASTRKAETDLFSRRERQIVAQIAIGATSAEIATRLSISIHTVKNHRKNILRKIGCSNSGQMIAKCVGLGII
ncbi:LuxR C-terminal-related transcriptional regulator [Microbulbifer bruguierae]|uniref:LuxR C-terminal-related transcriptional regulator n=1 Tax=Microbulbifer bruguierae TaxID=3029061 RepID=A0ABY8N7Y2_9GAMM|nr:LuxR C-terminal-related transcriptional regulator [Microbulbifer bruguierae]WGL14999.1 LuxR C-terminal-related transcriptional regulator [Microbulbifer bruguierae]